MPVQTINSLAGIDLRGLNLLSSMKTLRVGTNVLLSPAGGLETRPGTQRVAVLPAETKGLYAANGALRTAAPAGYADLFREQTAAVIFDFIGDGTKYAKDEIASVEGHVLYGAHVAAGVHSYLSVKRKDGSVELHWIRQRPAEDDGLVDTKVVNGRSMVGPIIRAGEKVFALDQVNGDAPFSSTEFGPDNFTAPEDAGHLPLLQHTRGDASLVGFGELQSTEGAAQRRQEALVVFMDNQTQVWAVDPDPLNHYLTHILHGVGAMSARSIVSVRGTPVFLGRSGFADLRGAAQIGNFEAGGIGAPIRKLTDSLAGEDITASFFWEQRGAYLCAAGNQVFVFVTDQLNNIHGWTTWTFPFSVTDFAEDRGEVYLRDTENQVHHLSLDYDTDSGADIEYDVETAFLHMGSPYGSKNYEFLTLYQQGTTEVSYRPDPRASDIEVPVFTVTDGRYTHQKIPLVAVSDGLALRFKGKGRWRLDGFSLQYDKLGV